MIDTIRVTEEPHGSGPGNQSLEVYDLSVDEVWENFTSLAVINKQLGMRQLCGIEVLHGSHIGWQSNENYLH